MIWRRTFLFLRRLVQIKLVILRLILGRRQSRPVRFRLFFERVGGAFLKLGQILSLRHDLIPPEYANELLNLLSRVPAEPWETMRKVLVEELNEVHEKIFTELNTQPLASASISQVYRARLPGGERVVVKIQRPGIRDVFETDFLLASFLGGWLSIFRFFSALQLQDIISEFIEATRRELDFREELSNALTMAAHASEHPRTIIPKYYSELSTERVVVAEYMEEVLPVEEVLAKLDAGPDSSETLERECRLSFEIMAYYFVHDLMRQYFVDGFFHADPHPANLFLASDNRLGYFDFGIIGRAGANRINLLRIVYGIAKKDLAFSSRHFMLFARSAIAGEIELFKHKDSTTYERYAKVIEKLEEIMTDNLRTDLEKILAPWYTEQSLKNYHHQTSSVVISKLILKAQDYSVYLPREIVMFFRTLVISDMVALRLAPNFNIITALNRFFDRYPLATLEELIGVENPQAEAEIELESTAHLSFEELLALKEAEAEEMAAAKERLINIISAYVEEYDEIRQLLKEC